jgi:hypothetical protein
MLLKSLPSVVRTKHQRFKCDSHLNPRRLRRLTGCYAAQGERNPTRLLLDFVLLVAALVLSMGVYATRSIPPTIEEVVSNSTNIGIVRILSARVYEPTDDEGAIPCPSIYKAEWIETFKGQGEEAEFSSDEKFALNSTVLVYLTDRELPRKLLSTNSRSEERRRAAEERSERCTLTKELPFTTPGTSSRFFDDQHLDEFYKTRTWIQYLGFFHKEFEVTTVFPQSYNVDGEVIPRDIFLSEFFDEARHGVVRSAGYQLLIYRAVDWTEYKSRLMELTGSGRRAE